MPGLVGIITKAPRQWAERQVKQMVDAICHEAFYQTGVWVDERLGAYVGWALRRGSFADGMPLQNETGGVTLFFSGEEFPDPGTVEALQQKGHQISGPGPQYLVHTYEDNAAFPANLNGRFHGLVADARRNTLTLFNDRYGMHRIYYHQLRDQSHEAFYFAAEAKAILAVRPELREVDPASLGELVSCGCVLNNKTLFKGIEIMPPASAWTLSKAVDGGIVKRTAYFEPREWEEQSVLDMESYYQGLRDVFARVLPRYFAAGGLGPMAMSVTGGLDTRMIMAWEQAAAGDLPCYSFGGPYRECHDVRLGREVAQACGQPHRVIPVGQDFLARISRYAERTVFLTDGTADVTRSADLYVNEQAKEIAPLRMTGNYGGEVLRRVRAFKPVTPRPGLFEPEFLKSVETARATYARTIEGHPLSFAVFRQAPWHHYGLYALEETQLAVRSPFLDNDFVRMVYRAPNEACTSNDICLRLIGDGKPELLKIPTDRGLMGSRGALGSALRRHLLEFTFKAEYAYDYGMPQWVAQADHLLAPLHLERLFLGRHKFYHYRVWYRDAFAQYVKEMLLDRRTLGRPYIEAKTLEALVTRHLRGDRNYTTEIHKVLTLEHIHRLFLDSPSPARQVNAESRNAPAEVAG